MDKENRILGRVQELRNLPNASGLVEKLIQASPDDSYRIATRLVHRLAILKPDRLDLLEAVTHIIYHQVDTENS